MKTKIVIAVLLLVLAGEKSFSQKKGFHIGIKGGVNGAILNGTSFQNNYKYNYLLGGFIQIPIVHKVSLQPEVLFSQSTYISSGNLSQPFDPSNPNNQNINLNYMNIPVLLNLGGALKFQIGPQYSILLNNNNTLLTNGQNAFKSGDFSLCTGLQWRTPLLGLHFGVRYLIGLANISAVTNEASWKSQAIQISTGFIF